MLRAGHAWRKELFENLRLDLAEYLQEETRDLPACAEANLFYREVDALSADYERLEARIARLNAAVAASSSPEPVQEAVIESPDEEPKNPRDSPGLDQDKITLARLDRILQDSTINH